MIVDGSLEWCGLKWEYSADVDVEGQVELQEVYVTLGGDKQEIKDIYGELHSCLIEELKTHAQENDDAPSMCSEAELYGVSQNWFI